ncbi:MAG: acylphosphatase [Rhodospirillaceae bacterium]|nr:acylphosphatase [Rhodospirillaceae bacterium]
MSQQAVHVRIVGRVQGVWYRGWTVDEATSLGLSGWVRNRRDGSVEAVFSGNQSAIDQMIEKCRIGPHSARVDQVLVEPENNEVQPGFNQLPTD